MHLRLKVTQGRRWIDTRVQPSLAPLGLPPTGYVVREGAKGARYVQNHRIHKVCEF